MNRLLASPANTRQIQGVDGLTFGIALTAQDVFDRRNADDTPAGDNVFAAVNALQTALQNNDEAGIQSAMQSVQAASSHLNSQLVFYGTAENRIQDALDQASHMETQENTALSQEVDADIAAASTELALNNTHQQAALAARSKLPQTTLFDFLA